MKKLLSAFIALTSAAALLCSCGQEPSYPQVFAHRGCWIKDFIPENSLDGVEMAALYGYPTTECDVRFTRDSVLVLMHDPSINRTMRNASDYSEIEEKTMVRDCAFEELRSGYVLASDDPDRRRPIPTLAEYLEKCGECGIKPILHCDVFEGYQEAARLYGSNWIAFTTEYDVCLKVRELAPDVLILYAIDKMEGDPAPEEVMEKLDRIGGRCGISSMGHVDLREEMCSALKEHGCETQSSIFRTPYEMKAVHDGATILLTDFAWFQTEGRKPYSSYVEKSLSMDNGKTLEKEWEKLEYAAMTIDITCKGDFELLVNGERSYSIGHDDKDTEHLGFRLYRQAPSIKLVSVEDGGELDCLRVRVYKIK